MNLSDVEVHSRVSRRKIIIQWFLRRMRTRYRRDSYLAKVATGALLLFSCMSMFGVALGIPTGLGTMLDILLILLLNTVVSLLAVSVLSILLSLIYTPLPLRLLAMGLYVSIQSFIILRYSSFDILSSSMMALIYTSVGLGLGLGVGLLMKWRIQLRKKLIMTTGIVCGITIVLFNWNLLEPLATPERIESSYAPPALSIQHSKQDDPSKQGAHAYYSFSYGSGDDNHREVFSSGTDVITTPVDASHIITSWGKLKEFFWGFDEQNLPINGRVWMPEGEGPYPLALMVHGNHLMEDFSDDGYAYLGELLASRGIIAISVDENFFNYSVWSSIPNDDMKMRAWLLLHHLQQIHQLSEASENPFSQRVNWEQIALIGHSRGGQAVAMAADAEKWFEDEPVMSLLEQITLRSIISIAPTDKWIEDERAVLDDVNYLTIQGASDADVNQFTGDRQYNRVDFSKQSDAFKAAVYIEDANHSQFNTSWGTMDERLPGGLFLNREGMLDGEDQRQIAKVLVSAFLEATLHNEADYRGLFQNVASGREWLPDTSIISRYEGATFIPIAQFETDAKSDASSNADGIDMIEQQPAKDRNGNSKGTDGMVLEWSQPGASYKIMLTQQERLKLQADQATSMSFSLTNLEWELSKELPPLPQVEIRLTLDTEEELHYPLDLLLPIQSPFYHSYLVSGWLESHYLGRKFKQQAEAVAQTYVIPLQSFIHANPKQDSMKHNLIAGRIACITFQFRTGPGKVMIDDVGFIPQGGTYIATTE